MTFAFCCCGLLYCCRVRLPMACCGVSSVFLCFIMGIIPLRLLLALGCLCVVVGGVVRRVLFSNTKRDVVDVCFPLICPCRSYIIYLPGCYMPQIVLPSPHLSDDPRACRVLCIIRVAIVRKNTILLKPAFYRIS